MYYKVVKVEFEILPTTGYGAVYMKSPQYPAETQKTNIASKTTGDALRLARDPAACVLTHQ